MISTNLKGWLLESEVRYVGGKFMHEPFGYIGWQVQSGKKLYKYGVCKFMGHYSYVGWLLKSSKTSELLRCSAMWAAWQNEAVWLVSVIPEAFSYASW